MAARVTTTSKHSHHPTVVPLTAADPLQGCVLADDLTQLYQDELTRLAGSISPATVAAVSRALRIALP
ncbi:MAG: type II toxin-antitoxin system PemK/MazF family toxin [Bifidobacteriaceae bacterium]|nr:type II toxin-antitoxin system PemK/MazF family toxin [Bifidobacteriaceae bacterium]